MGELGDIFERARTSIQNARTIIGSKIDIPIVEELGSQGDGVPSYEMPDRFDENGNPLSYTDIQQKSSHNSYNREETIFEQYRNENITSFELDIHNGDPGLFNFGGDNYAEDGDFYVYHDSGPGFGNIGSETHYPHLTDGLTDISLIHEHNPNHDVLTLHIDVKDMFDEGRGLGPEDLDRVLREQLGDDMLYTPGDLIDGSNTDTLTGAYAEGMPTLNELEGKVMIVLTGGDAELEAYVNGTDSPIGFISANPTYDTDGNFVPDPNAVFYNMNVSDLENSSQILDQDYILRAYGANDAESYQAAINAGVHHIGTDYISPGDNDFQTGASNEIFHQLEGAKDWGGERIEDVRDGAEWVQDRAADTKDWAVDRADDVQEWTGDRVEDVTNWGSNRVDDLQDGGEWVGDRVGDGKDWLEDKWPF